MKRHLKIAIRNVDIVRPLCNKLIGRDHASHHRITVGVAIIIGGVIISKTLGHVHFFPVAVVFDALGYGLHGIGLVPIIEYLFED